MISSRGAEFGSQLARRVQRDMIDLAAHPSAATVLNRLYNIEDDSIRSGLSERFALGARTLGSACLGRIF